MRKAQVPIIPGRNIYNVPYGVGFGNGGTAGFTGNNGFVTPEDEFDEFDDDNFLLAASQQVEKQMTEHDSAPLFKDSAESKQELLCKTGEIKVIRDKLQVLKAEKTKLEREHGEQLKAIESKYKKENVTLTSKLVFKDRDIAELQAKLLQKKDSTAHSSAKRPRLHSVTDKKVSNLQQHRLRGFRENRSNVRTSIINNIALNKASSSAERAIIVIQRALQQSNNVRIMFGLKNNKFLPTPTRQSQDTKLILKTIDHLISILNTDNPVEEQTSASDLLLDLGQCKEVQNKVCCDALDMMKGSDIVVECTSKILASVKSLDVWNKCTRSEGCPLKLFYQHPNKNILRYIYNIIYSVKTVHTCVCTKQLVKFVAKTIIVCVEEGDSVSYSCGLTILRAMMPYFVDLDLASTTQKFFHQALYIAKTADENLSEEADFLMYNARFDPNMSLSD